MAIAVINHADLAQFTDDLGFPKYTKVKLAPGGIGYQYYDRFVRDNVRWISQVDFDPATHVRITESAQLVGEIPEHWGLRHQQFLEGDEEFNAFKELDEGFGTHVNRNAIRLAVGNAMLKYQVDYVEESGSVVTDNALAIAVFDTPDDTSISYTTNLPVEQIWTTRLSEYNEIPYLEKRAYFNDPVKEESHPWIQVGPLTDEEVEIWKLHNERPEDKVNWANLDFRDIQTEAIQRAKPAGLFRSTGLGIAHLAS